MEKINTDNKHGLEKLRLNFSRCASHDEALLRLNNCHGNEPQLIRHHAIQSVWSYSYLDTQQSMSNSLLSACMTYSERHEFCPSLA